jgi:ferredoxin
VKVKADYDLCESNALCESFAPDVFQLDDDDNLNLLTEEVTPENIERIKQAVAACPKAALSIIED